MSESDTEGGVWTVIQNLFRKKAQKNAARMAMEKLQWCVLDGDTLSYYAASQGTKSKPKEKHLVGAYNVDQIIDCGMQSSNARSPMALRGLTLRFVGGKSVTLVPLTRAVDIELWVSEINSRRRYFRNQAQTTHKLVERGINKITRIADLKDELGIQASELPLNYSSILVKGGAESDDEVYDWVDPEDDEPEGERGALDNTNNDADDDEPHPPPTPSESFWNRLPPDTPVEPTRNQSSQQSTGPTTPPKAATRSPLLASDASPGTLEMASQYQEMLVTARQLEKDVEELEIKRSKSAAEHEKAMAAAHARGAKENQERLDAARVELQNSKDLGALTQAHRDALKQINDELVR